MKIAVLALACLAALPAAARADGMPEADVTEAVDAETTLAANETPAPKTERTAPSIDARASVAGEGAARSARVQVRAKGVTAPLFIYKVDGGPALITKDDDVRIRDLAPGKHEVSVVLAGEDAAPLGPSQTLTISLP
jgi:hypothetical protein